MSVLARLADDMSWLPSVIGVAIVVGMLAMWPLSSVLARRMARRGKVWVGAGAGRTRMSPLVPLLGSWSAVTAVFFLAAGLYDTSEQWRDPLTFYFWAGLVGLFALFSPVLSLGARETWEWDATGLRWRGAWRSRAVEMRWSDLLHLGKRKNGTLYVSDRTGRKISWYPNLTLEHEALLRAIRLARPDLRLPG